MDSSRISTMKSFSIMWAEGVQETEARLVVNTVKELVRLAHGICLKAGVGLGPTAIRPFGTWVIPSVPAGDPYSGTHWYIDTAFDAALGQVVASRFLDLVRREPWQSANPHFDVAILDRDLTDGPDRRPDGPDSQFVLSSVLPGTATVISVHRLREIANEGRRLRVLRRLVVHSLGHVLDVPRRDRDTQAEWSAGEHHCTAKCIMRHGANVDQLIALAAEEDAGKIVFCNACKEDLLRSVLLQRISKN
jgi:predicted Zn-dependent protease